MDKSPLFSKSVGKHQRSKSSTQNESKYGNVNLNQCKTYVPSTTFETSSTTNCKQEQVDHSIGNLYSQSNANKTSRRAPSLKPSDYLNIFEQDDRSIKHQASDSKNNSTLSLHIAAYETESTECSHDVFKQRSLSKIKKCFVELQACDFGLEFPRQQSDQDQIPEVMKFKTSQKLLDVQPFQIFGATKLPSRDEQKLSDSDINCFMESLLNKYQNHHQICILPICSAKTTELISPALSSTLAQIRIIVVPIRKADKTCCLAIFDISKSVAFYIDTLEPQPASDFEKVKNMLKAFYSFYLKSKLSFTVENSTSLLVDSQDEAAYTGAHVCRIAEQLVSDGRLSKLIPFDIEQDYERIIRILNLLRKPGFTSDMWEPTYQNFAANFMNQKMKIFVKYLAENKHDIQKVASTPIYSIDTNFSEHLQWHPERFEILIVPLHEGIHHSLAIFHFPDRKAVYINSIDTNVPNGFYKIKSNLEHFFNKKFPEQLFNFAVIEPINASNIINKQPDPAFTGFHMCRLIEEIYSTGEINILHPFNIHKEGKRILNIVELIDNPEWRTNPDWPQTLQSIFAESCGYLQMDYETPGDDKSLYISEQQLDKFLKCLVEVGFNHHQVGIIFVAFSTNLESKIYDHLHPKNEKLDLLLVPIGYKEHVTMAVFDIKAFSCTYFDSQKGTLPKTFERIKQAIENYYNGKEFSGPTLFYATNQINEQFDKYNCGVFVSILTELFMFEGEHRLLCPFNIQEERLRISTIIRLINDPKWDKKAWIYRWKCYDNHDNNMNLLEYKMDALTPNVSLNCTDDENEKLAEQLSDCLKRNDIKKPIQQPPPDSKAEEAKEIQKLIFFLTKEQQLIEEKRKNFESSEAGKSLPSIIATLKILSTDINTCIDTITTAPKEDQSNNVIPAAGATTKKAESDDDL